MSKILDYLFSIKDEKYKDFISKLIPTKPKEHFIGIKNPVLRNYAKVLYKNDYEEAIEFLNTLPHTYYEEYMLHTYLIELIKDYDEVIFLDIRKIFAYNLSPCQNNHNCNCI